MARPRRTSDLELVAAASRAVARRGPQALTLADVAAEAGVVPATLVQRFGSKRDLLLAVAARGVEGVAGVFAAARASSPSPAAALEEGLATLASSVGDPDEVANHLAFLALDLTDPAFRAHAAAHVDAVRTEVAALLADAGDVPPGRRDEVTEAVLAVYQGSLLLWAIDRHEGPEVLVRRGLRAVLG